MIRDVLGLTVGTLTRIPVPAPKRVDRRIAGVSMSLAPLAGLLVGALAAALIVVLQLAVLQHATADTRALTALLIAVLVVAFVAWMTRAMHLDGLADFADALGSGKPAEQALEIARRSDIGPFGVITVVLTLLVQISALAMLVLDGLGVIGIVIALTASRIAVPVATRDGVPAVRPDGLGATVAGTVRPFVPVAWTAVVAASAAWTLAAADAGPAGWAPAGALAVVLAALSAAWVVRVARKRLGGMTGDVIGAAIEAATTVALVTLALLT